MTSPEPTAAGRYPAGCAAFPHRDLTGLAGLAPWEILFLLDEAEQWVQLNRQPHKRVERLAGLTIINAFFENSTRTLLSFEIAGKRLGADDALQVYALSSAIERIVGDGGQIGRIALALASSRITVKAAEEVQHAAEHAQDN